MAWDAGAREQKQQLETALSQAEARIQELDKAVATSNAEQAKTAWEFKSQTQATDTIRQQIAEARADATRLLQSRDEATASSLFSQSSMEAVQRDIDVATSVLRAKTKEAEHLASQLDSARVDINHLQEALDNALGDLMKTGEELSVQRQKEEEQKVMGGKQKVVDAHAAHLRAVLEKALVYAI